MSNYFTASQLRAMGACVIEGDILRVPPDQGVGEHGSVDLKPDPESLRVFNFKERERELAAKARAVSGPAKGPAGALNRMMSRLQRRGLIPRGPKAYATLKQPAVKMTSSPKPQMKVTAMSITKMSINLLRTKPAARAGLKQLSFLPQGAKKAARFAETAMRPMAGPVPAALAALVL